MLLGGGVVQRFHLRLAVLLMGVGVTYFVLAIPMLLAEPSDLSPPTQIKEPLRLAISPLAVPALISPLAVAAPFFGFSCGRRPPFRLLFFGLLAVRFGPSSGP